MIGWLARACWRFYGYRNGMAKCHHFYQSGRGLAEFTKQEIAAHRPYLLCLFSGVYQKHSVTVVGCETWQVGDLEYTCLKLYDHWHLAPYWIPISGVDPIYGGSMFEVCQVIPPPSIKTD